MKFEAKNSSILIISTIGLCAVALANTNTVEDIKETIKTATLLSDSIISKQGIGEHHIVPFHSPIVINALSSTPDKYQWGLIKQATKEGDNYYLKNVLFTNLDTNEDVIAPQGNNNEEQGWLNLPAQDGKYKATALFNHSFCRYERGGFLWLFKDLECYPRSPKIIETHLHIDKQAPSIGNLTIQNEQNATSISLKEQNVSLVVNDNLGNITNGKVRVFEIKNGSEKQIYQSALDTNNSNISFSLPKPTNITPSNRYRMEFTFTDQAENTAHYSHGYQYNLICPQPLPKPVAIFQENINTRFLNQHEFQGFVAWKSGDPIHGNPVTVLWELDNSTIEGNHYNGYKVQPVLSIGTKAYFITQDIEVTDTPNIANGSFSVEGLNCLPFNSLKGALSSEHLPRITNLSALFNNANQVRNTPKVHYQKISPAPYENAFIKEISTLTGINVEVEPKRYTQVAQHLPTQLTCEIAPSQNQCTIELNKQVMHAQWFLEDIRVSSKNAPKIANVTNKVAYASDYQPAVIQSLSYTPENKRGNITIIDEDALQQFNHVYTLWRPTKVKMTFLNKENRKIKALNFSNEEIQQQSDKKIFTVDFHLLDFEEGKYTLQNISVEDSFGNIVERKLNPNNISNSDEYIFNIDHSAPQIGILFDADKTGQNTRLLSGASELPKISDLKQLSVRLFDKNNYSLNEVSLALLKTVDSNIASTPIEIGYSLNKGTDNSVMGEVADVISLLYPLMPSTKEGEIYQLKIAATDEFDNSNRQTFQFKYEPEILRFSGGINDKLMIPALPVEFFDNTEKNQPLTAVQYPFVDKNLQEQVLSIRLDESSDISLVVNGTTISAGENKVITVRHQSKTLPNEETRDFVPISITAFESGLIGEAQLIIQSTSANAPIYEVNVQTWQAGGQLQSQKTEYRQIIENVLVNLLPAENTICRFTDSEAFAQQSNPIKNPYCLIEWANLPEGLSPVKASTKVAVGGNIAKLGNQTIGYTISLFNGNGMKYLLSHGEFSLTGVSPMGHVKTEPKNSNLNFKRFVQNVEIQLHETSNYCDLTVDENIARASWAQFNQERYENQKRYCLVEWLQLPEGISQNSIKTAPVTTGYVAHEGEMPLSWRTSIFSKTGTKIIVGKENSMIQMQNPNPPTIEIKSEFTLNESQETIIVHQDERRIGQAIFNADLGTVRVVAKHNERTIVAKNFKVDRSHTSKNTGALDLPLQSAELQQMQQYKISAFYTDLPEVIAEKNINVYIAPAKSIQPQLTIPAEVVSTDTLPIQVTMIDSSAKNHLYNEDRIGQWEVKLYQVLTQGKENQLEPLTDYLPMQEGVLQTNLDISRFNDTNALRIVAHAKWVHSIPNYEYIVKSKSIARVNIHDGKALNGNIVARKLSGIAPFQSSFYLKFDDKKSTQNVGTIRWQMSNDNVTWKDVQTKGKADLFWSHKFDVGTYYIKAIIENKHSKAISQTEIIKVFVYENFKINITGHSAIFTGDNTELGINAYIPVLSEKGSVIDKKSIPLEELFIEWSIDGGKTFSHIGQNINVSQDTPKNLLIVARAKRLEAIESNGSIFHSDSHVLQVVRPKAPMLFVYGENRLEEGKEYTFSINMTVPYSNLKGIIDYEILLPSGEKIKNHALTNENTSIKHYFKYTVSAEDYKNSSIDFKVTAKMRNFEDSTSITKVLKAKTWQYRFPQFELRMSQDTHFAPSTIRLSVHALGADHHIENPTYEWDIPSNAQKLQSNAQNVERVYFSEPGDYNISVTVSDSRGNSTVLVKQLTIHEPSPYVISLRLQESNKHKTEPLTIKVRAMAKGGHPKDRIQSAYYELNGIREQKFQNGIFENLPAGEHTIRFVANSIMGKTVQTQETIHVQKNKLPICPAIKATKSSVFITAEARCHDSDGHIKSHEWKINGEILKNYSSGRLSIPIREFPINPTISVRAIDNANQYSEEVTVLFEEN